MENIEKEVLANYLEVSKIPDDFIIDDKLYCVKTVDKVDDDYNRCLNSTCGFWLNEMNHYLKDCPFRDCVSINEEMIYDYISDSMDIQDVYDTWDILEEHYEYQNDFYLILSKDI